MPSAGLQIFSSGMRLQPVTPGVKDVGNYRISGIGICDGFAESFGSMAEGQNNQLFGFSWNPVGLNTFKTANVGLATYNGGTKPQIGDIGAPNNPVSYCVCIGAEAAAQNSGGVSIGGNANTATVAWGGTREGGNVAIGRTATSTTLNRTAGQSYSSVAIGRNARADGDEFSIAIGGTCQAVAGRSICIGLASATITFTRAIMIDTDGASATVAGQIQIGNSNHTGPITIGPINLTNGAGTKARSVADVDTTATASDGSIQYSTLTAARVVTLPLANAVPQGYRLKVTDFSGSASGVNTITLTRSGADTINAGTTVAVNTAYGSREIESDGVSKWVVIRTF